MLLIPRSEESVYTLTRYFLISSRFCFTSSTVTHLDANKHSHILHVYTHVRMNFVVNTRTHNQSLTLGKCKTALIGDQRIGTVFRCVCVHVPCGTWAILSPCLSLHVYVCMRTCMFACASVLYDVYHLKMCPVPYLYTLLQNQSTTYCN